MPKSAHTSHDTIRTWWRRAGVTGAIVVVLWITAIVAFSMAVQAQTFGQTAICQAIGTGATLAALVLIGATTYCIGRAHELKASRYYGCDQCRRNGSC